MHFLAISIADSLANCSLVIKVNLFIPCICGVCNTRPGMCRLLKCVYLWILDIILGFGVKNINPVQYYKK